MAGRIQARELLPGAQLPATESLWTEASHWACDAVNRTATSTNPANKSPYDMWYGKLPPEVLLPFLKPGYCKVKRENKSQAKAQEFFTWAPRLATPGTPYECCPNTVLYLSRVMPPGNACRLHPLYLPRCMPPCLRKRRGPRPTTRARQVEVGRKIDEKDEGLDHLIDLDVTWGFGLHAFLRERSQETPAAGHAIDGTVETMDSSQGGTMDASSVPPARAETVETTDSSQGGTMATFSVPAGRAETVETTDSSQGGTMDASSVPAGRAESGSGASAASGTDQGNGEDPPAVLSGREAHELSSWGRLPPTVMGRTRGQSQRLQDESAQRQRVIEDAMSVTVQKWTEFGSILENTSWTTEDAMSMMAGGPAVEDYKGELRVCMPSGFPEDVEPPPQSVADVERSKYKAAWLEAMKNELNRHKTTGTNKTATPPRGRKPVGAKWVFSYKTEKDGIIAKTKARLVAKGFSRVKDVEYFHTIAPIPSSVSTKILAAVANEQGLKFFHVNVAQASVRAKLDAEIYMKLPDGCGDMSGKIVGLNR